MASELWGQGGTLYPQVKDTAYVKILSKRQTTRLYKVRTNLYPPPTYENVATRLSQPACDVNHKPDGRLPLLFAKPAVTPATLKMAATNFCCLVNRGTMGVNSLPKAVTRQRRGCDLNPGPSAPKSSTLTTRLPSHPIAGITWHSVWS